MAIEIGNSEVQEIEIVITENDTVGNEEIKESEDITL